MKKANPEKLHITIPIILTFLKWQNYCSGEWVTGCQAKREVGVVIKKSNRREDFCGS